ncbi:MAG: nucleotidyltransferase domain-containing protein [Bacteroidales bacterium]|nr:nucleotidyltransferase domain-containing protein [Bacteroidales bacterium]
MDNVFMSKLRELAAEIIPAGGHVYLYGSRARGDERSDSDWDLLILLDKEKSNFNYDHDNYIYPFVELGWNFGYDVSPLSYTYKEWEIRHITPFYKNVENDKILIL